MASIAHTTGSMSRATATLTVCTSTTFRSIWPYRDYVIKSYNQNKPFDQFVKEQIAGDMLPKKTLDTIDRVRVLARRHQFR